MAVGDNHEVEICWLVNFADQILVGAVSSMFLFMVCHLIIEFCEYFRVRVRELGNILQLFIRMCLNKPEFERAANERATCLRC